MIRALSILISWMALICSPLTHASRIILDQETDLFNLSNSKSSGQIMSQVVSFPSSSEYFGMECSVVMPIRIQDFRDSRTNVVQSGITVVEYEITDIQYVTPCWVTADVKTTQYWGNGDFRSETFQDDVEVAKYGFQETIINQCPPDGGDFNDHIVEVEIAGVLKCYSPDYLNNNDSCDINNPDVIPANSEEPIVCFNKPDGSQCALGLTEVNGQPFYTQLAEPSSCYIGDYPVASLLEPPTGTPVCEKLGSSTFCIENPENVCQGSGGVQVCETGCGYVQFNGTDVFGCFDEDLDNDGIPNQFDPDIDGDGIRNDEDLDSDGDGNDDPNYQNNSVISGGGVFTLTDTDRQALADAVRDGIDLESLKENYSSSTLDAFVNSITDEGYGDKLTELLNHDSAKFADLVQEKGTENTLNELRDLFQPSGCSAVFEIGKGYTIDICAIAQKTEPFLYILFAIGTALFAFFRVRDTLITV